MASSHDDGDPPLRYGPRRLAERARSTAGSLRRARRQLQAARENSESDAVPSDLSRWESAGLLLLVLIHGPADALTTAVAGSAQFARETSPLVRVFIYSAENPSNGSALGEYAVMALVLTVLAAVGADLLRKLRTSGLPLLASVDAPGARLLLVGWRLSVVGLLLLGANAVVGNLAVAGWFA